MTCNSFKIIRRSTLSSAKRELAIHILDLQEEVAYKILFSQMHLALRTTIFRKVYTKITHTQEEQRELFFSYRNKIDGTTSAFAARSVDMYSHHAAVKLMIGCTLLILFLSVLMLIPKSSAVFVLLFYVSFAMSVRYEFFSLRSVLSRQIVRCGLSLAAPSRRCR
jgi:hypothetical protein